MIKNVTAASNVNAVISNKPVAADVKAAASAAAKPEKTILINQSVPSAAQINAEAFRQRQQIASALYDRSFTLAEGVTALKRQDAIAAYAAKITAKEGGPTAQDLAKLDKKLDKADAQIQKLSTNAKGADLDSLEAIDGRELDIVQENLANRIRDGIKDGSLTEEEGKGLLKRQDDLNALETKLRESDGKLTAGEQKSMLDQMRKMADDVNRLRHNDAGVNITYKNYSDSIDNRQAALERELQRGIKLGSLTEKEVETVRAEFEKANTLETELRGDERIDWKDHTKLSTALNEAEIKLYDLQRNTKGVQLKEQYIDVKHVDMREAQQLESVARGISNKALTDDEGIELLNDQRRIQNMEERFVKSGDGMNRSEYLRLQSEMNDFSLRNHELQTNKDRWNGIMPQAGSAAPAAAPVKPVPVASTPGPVSAPAPSAVKREAAAPVVAPAVALAVAPPVAPVVAPPVSPAVSEVKAEVKAENKVEPPSSSVSVAVFSPSDPKRPNFKSEIEGEHLADMLRSHSERAGRGREELSKRDHNDDKREHDVKQGVRHAENERNVFAYAKTEQAAKNEPVLTKMVA